MWVNGKRHGYGIFSWSNGNGEYMGQWVDGVQVGLNLFACFFFGHRNLSNSSSN